LNAKVAAAFLNPTEFKWANNHSEKCFSRGATAPEDVALNAKYCTKAAPSAKFALSDAYDYRIVGAAKPIGAQYLANPPTYLKGLPNAYRIATPDDLINFVVKSRAK
jgi:hypothetical protein